MRRITRRSLLSALASTVVSGQVITKRSSKVPPLGPLRGEFVRYLDPETETPVVRLTNPTSSSVLPDPFGKFVSLKGHFLVFSSDRGGNFVPYRVDLRSGFVQQIATAQKLVTSSPTLDANERHLLFLDGTELREAVLGGRESHVVADGVSAFAAPRAAGELVLIRGTRLQARQGTVLADNASGPCLLSPDGTQCLFTRWGELWMVPLAGGNPRLVAKAPISYPFWSEDGSRVLYLRGSDICESTLDGAERVLAHTSRFSAFSPNQDGSVFVGASASKAQPFILLLLRMTRRELPLCEHGPADLSCPVFAPDNRRVYFQSSRDGKPAIYSVNTEALVESAS